MGKQIRKRAKPTFTKPPAIFWIHGATKPRRNALIAREPGTGAEYKEWRNLQLRDVRLPRCLLFALLLAFLSTVVIAAPHAGVNYVKLQVAGVPVHLVDVDLRRDDLVVRPIVAPNGHRQSFGQMVAQNRPVAAVNGTFFDTATGITVGNLVSDGRMLSEGMVGSNLVFYKDGSVNLLSSSRNLGRYKDWSDVDFAVGGGLTLLSGGEFFVDPRSEGFTDPSLFSPRPRSAIGVTQEGRLRMVVVTQGVSLWQLARVMKELKCLHAINIDGGSSTGLSVGGTTMVSPRRKLTNILGVFPAHQKPTLGRAVHVASSRAQGHYKKGQELLNQGDVRLARSQLRQAVAKAPEQAGYWRAAGLTEWRHGDLARAVKDLHRSMSLYFDRGDLVAANLVVEEILQIDALHTAAHLVSGECKVEQGLDEQAAVHLKLVLEGQPGHPKAVELMEVIDFRARSLQELRSSGAGIEEFLRSLH